MQQTKTRQTLWVVIVAFLVAGWGYREISFEKQVQRLGTEIINVEQNNADLRLEIASLNTSLQDALAQQDPVQRSDQQPGAPETNHKRSLEDVLSEANELVVDGFNQALDVAVDVLSEQLENARQLLEEQSKPVAKPPIESSLVI